MSIGTFATSSIVKMLVLSVLLTSVFPIVSANAQLLTEGTPLLNANDDSTVTNEDNPVIINVLENDQHIGAGNMKVESVTTPINGLAVINADNTITYTPKNDFFGSDNFKYTVSDSDGGTGLLSDTATVTITVNSVNDPPVANDDFVTTDEDTTVSFFAEQNDFDVDSDEMFVASVEQGANGSAEISENGAIAYTPDPDFNGQDSFSYTVSDGNGGTDTATVSVTINPVNDAPVAADDSAATDEDAPATITVLSNDSDPDGDALSVASASAPSNGAAVVNADNTITYSPDPDFNGQDSFSYTVSDGNGGTDTATVSVTINPVNDAPVAVSDTASTTSPVTIDVLANDFDQDNDALNVISISKPSNGTAVINADNTLTYAPNSGFFGNDSFTYSISDGNGGTSTTSVLITVNLISLEKVQSGLVVIDPLNNVTMTKEELQNDKRYWEEYLGSAVNTFEPDAPFDFFQNASGRYVGVQSPSNGTYAGFYAKSESTDAQLFHGVVTTPMRTIPDQFFQNGLYVQTDNGLINYVACYSVTGKFDTTWHLVRTMGNVTLATTFEVLWSDTTPNQPLTRDCTIVTNGDNLLKLYMDGVKVYENSNLDLQMPPPFWYFLEPQNSYTEMFYGIYNDYYATKNEFLTVTNLPEKASKIQLVDQDNNTITETEVNKATKTAKMEIGMFHFPINADVRVLDSDLKEIIAANNQEIYGGDVYSIVFSSIWTPKIGTTWNIQLQETVDQSIDVELYAIDMFDNNKTIVDSLHAKGSKVICYISAGTWEEWRPDAHIFPSEVIGKNFTGHPREKWLDIRQIDVLGPIMKDRLDLCKQKGFDGVDADVVDAYTHDTGFAITYEDQLRYNTWLANEAHKRGLSIGLKNDLGQINDLVGDFDFSINEQCNEFNECHLLKPFIEFGKPVFHIEYVESGQTIDSFCPESIRNKFSGILKQVNLTAWHEACKITNPTSILEILTESTNGTSLTGFFATINYDNVTKSGFTPVSFEVPSGKFITIEVSSFGNFVFDHWKDDNNTKMPRKVWLMKDSDFTVVLRDTSSNSTGVN